MGPVSAHCRLKHVIRTDLSKYPRLDNSSSRNHGSCHAGTGLNVLLVLFKGEDIAVANHRQRTGSRDTLANIAPVSQPGIPACQNFEEFTGSRINCSTTEPADRIAGLS